MERHRLAAGRARDDSVTVADVDAGDDADRVRHGGGGPRGSTRIPDCLGDANSPSDPRGIGGTEPVPLTDRDGDTERSGGVGKTPPGLVADTSRGARWQWAACGDQLKSSGMTTEYSISETDDFAAADLRRLLVDFAEDEQTHFDHPLRTTAEITEQASGVRRNFVGDNVIYVARDAEGRAVGLAWCALYDPGNGLEGELVELIVEPQWRGRGVAKALCAKVMHLFRSRGVSFASVWTRGDNPAALAVYESAGFRPTEQTVLTWLPLD